MPQYVSQAHHYPASSTRSGLVRHAEGAGALLAFGAFEEPSRAPVSAGYADDSGRTRRARCERMARRDGHRDREHTSPERLQDSTTSARHEHAAVMRLESFRVLLSIAPWFDLGLRQFDLSVAYLHGEIDGDVYMEPPPGHGDGDSVWKLLKGLYGLMQAGRIWHRRLKAGMYELGYTQFRIGTRKKGDSGRVHVLGL